MFNFFRKKMNSGAIDDYRPEVERAKDFLFEEVVSTPQAVVFTPTSPEEWKVYPRRNQVQSSSCVAHTIAKMAGVLRENNTKEFVDYSASDIYQKRKNRKWGHNLGMWGTDAFNIWRKTGITLEAVMASDGLNEQQIHQVPYQQFDSEVGAISKLGKYIMLPIGNFDVAVSTMKATGKPLMVWFKFDRNEWGEQPVIKKVKPLSKYKLHHSVTATGNVGIYKGKQQFTIEDSWGSVGIKGLGVRSITREFFEARNTFCAYPTSFKTYEEMGIDKKEKPFHNFTRVLTYGMKRDKDVIALQNVLKYEGLFPANQSSTGNYLEITRRAVLAYQRKYKVASEKELNEVNGKRVGSKTLVVLNK